MEHKAPIPVSYFSRTCQMIYLVIRQVAKNLAKNFLSLLPKESKIKKKMEEIRYLTYLS